MDFFNCLSSSMPLISPRVLTWKMWIMMEVVCLIAVPSCPLCFLNADEEQVCATIFSHDGRYAFFRS